MCIRDSHQGVPRGGGQRPHRPVCPPGGDSLLSGRERGGEIHSHGHSLRAATARRGDHPPAGGRGAPGVSQRRHPPRVGNCLLYTSSRHRPLPTRGERSPWRAGGFFAALLRRAPAPGLRPAAPQPKAPPETAVSGGAFGLPPARRKEGATLALPFPGGGSSPARSTCRAVPPSGAGCGPFRCGRAARCV